jgi:hypothetical protein
VVPPDLVVVSVAIPPVMWAIERIIRDVLDYRLARRIEEKEGSPGLLDLAELERARRHKRRRLKLPRIKTKAGGAPQKSLPGNPVDDWPAA